MLTNTRVMTANYRLQKWTSIIQKQKESNLNIRAYCEEIGISEQSYYYWQRKLREVANEKLTKAQDEMNGLVPARSETPVIWAEVNVNATKTKTSPANNNIEICRDGWTIKVESGFDKDLLIETLQAVNRICY